MKVRIQYNIGACFTTLLWRGEMCKGEQTSDQNHLKVHLLLLFRGLTGTFNTGTLLVSKIMLLVLRRLNMQTCDPAAIKGGCVVISATICIARSFSCVHSAPCVLETISSFSIQTTYRGPNTVIDCPACVQSRKVFLEQGDCHCTTYSIEVLKTAFFFSLSSNLSASHLSVRVQSHAADRNKLSNT